MVVIPRHKHINSLGIDRGRHLRGGRRGLDLGHSPLATLLLLLLEIVALEGAVVDVDEAASSAGAVNCSHFHFQSNDSVILDFFFGELRSAPKCAHHRLFYFLKTFKSIDFYLFSFLLYIFL